MSSGAETLSDAKSARLGPPQMRLARFEDYEQIARLESSFAMDSRSAEDWRGLWLNNPVWPRVSATWPIGWVFEDEGGRVVGSIISVPSLYTLGGRELICANGRAWVVAEEYRGYAVWLMDEYLNQPGADLFVNTTVGSRAAAVLNQLSTRVPLGDWQTLAYWVTGYVAFAGRALGKKKVPLAGALKYPAGAGLWMKDSIFNKSLPAPPASVVVEERENFDERFNGFWVELIRQNPGKLLSCRDSRALSWHFAMPIRNRRLRVFTASRNGLLKAYCVVKRQDVGQGVPRIRVIDYQTVEQGEDLLPCLLGAARKRCIAEGICIFDHLGGGLPKMRSVDELAPYRMKLSTWPFYYKAPDVGLNAELAKAETWDPSLFDGDASYE